MRRRIRSEACFPELPADRSSFRSRPRVRIGREIVEVATFRAASGRRRGRCKHEGRITVDGRVVRDNVYGSREEDAWRRDFSVNSLYYNIADFSVVDYTGGMADLKEGRLRLIGEPDRRFREDPVRMLRAVRFAAKLGFAVDGAASAAIPKCREWLLEVASARLFEEVVKLFLGGAARRAFFAAASLYGLFALLFPDDRRLPRIGGGRSGSRSRERLHRPGAFANTDARIAEEKPVTPAFLFAALLWPVAAPGSRALSAGAWRKRCAGDRISRSAWSIARQELAAWFPFPAAARIVTREIWEMQPRAWLARRGRRALGLDDASSFPGRVRLPRSCVRRRASRCSDHCDWWTRLLESEGGARNAMRGSLLPPGRLAAGAGGRGESSGPRRSMKRRSERPCRGFPGEVASSDKGGARFAAWWR